MFLDGIQRDHIQVVVPESAFAFKHCAPGLAAACSLPAALPKWQAGGCRESADFFEIWGQGSFDSKELSDATLGEQNTVPDLPLLCAFSGSFLPAGQALRARLAEGKMENVTEINQSSVRHPP